MQLSWQICKYVSVCEACCQKHSLFGAIVAVKSSGDCWDEDCRKDCDKGKGGLGRLDYILFLNLTEKLTG